MPDVETMQPLIQAVGWMLIHFLWQGCAIAAVLWVILRCSRNSSSEFRYGWGLMACLCVAVVPVVTLLTLLERSAPVGARAISELPAMTVLVNGYGAGGARWLQLALEPALPFIVGLWALGVALLSARTLLGWWGARRLVRIGVERVGDELEQALSRLKDLVGVHRSIRLLRSVRVSVPTVIGWIKPVILLPAGVITTLPMAQLEMVIAHELAHVRRWDYLINLLQLCIETLFFYHPAVRWISRQVRQEREHCCDDLVVARCGAPVVYARALASLETLRGHACSPALAATGGDLFTRVSRIVQREAPRASSGMAQFSLVISLAMVAGLGAGQGMDHVFRHFDSRSGPSLDSAVISTGLASLGDGWSQHVSRWTPPDPDSPLAANTESAFQPVSETRASRSGEPKGNSETSSRLDPSAADLFRPPATPSLPELASLAPRPTMTREDILIESAVPIPGNVSVLPLFTVNPEYPPEALAQGIGGQVKLRFRVDRQGRAIDIDVMRSQPEKVFDDAARQALQQWTFQVNAEHDPQALLAQTFDFTWEEVVQAGRRQHAKDCMRTGTRVCSRPYTDEHVVEFRPRSSAIPGTD